MTDKIEVLFTHITPTDHQLLRIKIIQAYAAAQAELVVNYVPSGADQSAAIRKIREAVFTATDAILREEGEAKLDDIQANAFTDIFKSIFGFFKGAFSQGDASKIEIGVTTFVKTDLGALAVDAVEFIETSLPGSTDNEKRDAAVAKLKTDAAAAGKDLSAFALSTLNWFIETALQYVVAKGLTAAAAVAVHV